MKRIDKVKDYVEKKCKVALEKGVDPKVDAKSVAKALNIYRSDASSDLNKLFKMGILVKYGKRPVKYATLKEYQIIKKYLKEEKNNFNEIQTVTKERRNPQIYESINNNPFEKMIGYNGSLKNQIELAKAAVTYPPNGIHTLILGETGVGKSLLAESMWRYGVEIGVFKTQNLNKIPPFVVFNCAEYADNPQLLLSQLFGYIKGAFTGALESREGLVERAQGGILFLDEIHRLPPKGQELLFNLIDKGTYRRLGETKEDRKAQLMIVGATSEDPSSCLLAAFRRRIPVQITLPSLSNRPIDERVSLIIHFLSQEAQRLGMPIFISGDALRIFTLYNCPSNIGELKNDLLLCCAKSYLSYITSSTDKLIINMDVIPQRIYSMVKDEVITDPSILKLFYEGFIVDPKNSRNVYKISNDSGLITDLFDFVDKKIEKYKLYNIKPDEIETKVGEDLEKFFYETIGALQEHKNINIPDDVINTSVRSTADKILSKASQKLERKYAKEILIALTLHLQQFIKRSKSSKSIYNPYLKQIKTKYREEYKVIEENLDLLEKNLKQNIQEDEIGFLAMFLRHKQTFNKNLKNKVKVIIVSNGKSTATSISEFVNSLLGIEHIKAVNAPVSKNISNIMNELKHLIIKENEGKGVLILTDMYFLVNMENQLSQDTKIPIKIIPNVSTDLALEVGKKTLTTFESLNQIANEIEKNNYYYSTDLLSSNGKRLDTNRKTIITICPTGIGTAQKIKEIILNNIPITRTANILTLSMFDQLDSVKKILGKHLCVIIGSINPGIHDVPFIAVNEILTKDGLKKVERLLKDWDKQNESEFLFGGKISKEKVFELLDDQINKFVTSLPLDKTKECCKKIVKEVEERIYKKQIPLDLLVRIYLHSACMCDRLRKKPLLMPEWGMKLMTEKAKEFNILKDIVTNAVNILNLEVPSSEICYFLMSLTF